MKRAIYVGPEFDDLKYGMTGAIVPVTGSTDYLGFALDSNEGYILGVPRQNLYITSEDQQRHCPKPL